MTDRDKPTVPQLTLALEHLTADEVELLAGYVDAIDRGLHVTAVGTQHAVLKRVALKLAAHRPRKEGA